MGAKEWFFVLLLVAGLGLVVAGAWLIWDWANSITRFLDWVRFCGEWVFHAPLFLYEWRCDKWTAPFDLGLAWIALGALLTVVGAYMVGYTRE